MFECVTQTIDQPAPVAKKFIALFNQSNQLTHVHTLRLERAKTFSMAGNQIHRQFRISRIVFGATGRECFTVVCQRGWIDGARAFTLQHPPVQQVEDVTRIEDLPDLSDADLGRMRAIRDEARQKNGVTPPS